MAQPEDVAAVLATLLALPRTQDTKQGAACICKQSQVLGLPAAVRLAPDASLHAHALGGISQDLQPFGALSIIAGRIGSSIL